MDLADPVDQMMNSKKLQIEEKTNGSDALTLLEKGPTIKKTKGNNVFLQKLLKTQRKSMLSPSYPVL